MTGMALKMAATTLAPRETERASLKNLNPIKRTTMRAMPPPTYALETWSGRRW